LVSVIHDSETYPSTARDGSAPATRPRRPLRVEKNAPLLLLDESQLKKHPLYPKEGASREKEKGFSPLSVDHPSSRTIARRPRALDASAARTSARSMMSNIIHHPIASSFDVHRRGRGRGRGRSSLAIAHPSSGRPSFFNLRASARVVERNVLVAVRAPDHHGLGVGHLAGGDGDGLGDLRGGLGDSGHDDLRSGAIMPPRATDDPRPRDTSRRPRGGRAFVSTSPDSSQVEVVTCIFIYLDGI